MLVLTRKPDERIQLGDNIEIVVLEICRNKVKLGIQCPPQIPIYRKELLLHSKRHSFSEKNVSQN